MFSGATVTSCSRRRTRLQILMWAALLCVLCARAVGEAAIETIAERLHKLHSPPSPTREPTPQHERLRGGRSHLREEYEDFDAEDKKGHLFNESLQRHEAHLETVARMEGHHSHRVEQTGHRGENRSPASQGGVGPVGRPEDGAVTGEEDGGQADADALRLIDSESNEYVLVRPHEGVEQMELQEDKALLSDVVKVVVAAAVGGLLAGALGQPVITGYLIAGSVVGPGGLGIIEELVQVETLSQFGAIFLIFVLGVEFSTAQLRPVLFVSLLGGATIVFLLGASGLFTALLFGAGWKPGLLVGMFVSMSSTAVVIKCLMETHHLDTRHGRVMLGILLLQDCLVGFFLAMMPALAYTDDGLGAVGVAALREVLKLGVFLAAALMFSKVAMPHVLATLQRLSNHSAELFQLAIIAECLGVALSSEHLGLSIEVGAFVGGLMLSSSQYSHQILNSIDPVRNLFAALFLSSIGLVMHPHFIWGHIELLLLSAAVVVSAKVLITVAVVRLCGDALQTSLLVGIGLGQVGEFAFLLLSHAKRLKLLPKRMYLLTLGTTAISLLLTPLQWKAALFLADRASGHWQDADNATSPPHPHDLQSETPSDIGHLTSTLARSPATLGGAKQE